MKKGAYNKVLTVAAVLSFLIASVEGYIFYGEYAEFGFFRILLTVQNSIKAFLFSPSISAEDVLKTLSDVGSSLELYAGLAYVVAAFVAPLCTATALFVAAERFFRKGLERWRSRRQEGTLVFGYNRDVKALLKNHDGKSGVVHVVADVELPEKEERELMKRNIFFRRMDCVYAPEESLRELLEEVRARQIKKIFLLDDSSMHNASLYLRLCKLAQSGPEGAVFPKGAVCCCRCTEDCVRELAADYFDRERPSLGLYLFDLAELRVRKTFSRYPIWGNDFQTPGAPDPTLPAEQFNVHILIVGFGGVGEQFLRQAVNLGVAHSDSTILIDVVDQDALQKKELFCSALELDDAFVGDNEIRVGAGCPGADLADGLLRIRFHEIDVRGNRFSQFLRDTAAEMPLAYAAVCIKDLDVGIRCVSAIERYTADETHPFPVAVKLDCSEQLAEYLDKNDKTFGNVFAMGGAGPEKDFTLVDIYNSSTEKKARDYHEIYRSISFAPQGEVVTPGAGWDALKLYQQQANRLLCYHAQTKAYVLSCADSRDPRSVLQEHLRAAGIALEDGKFTYSDSEEEMLRRVEESPLLRELLHMEHRRWCYAMILAGWSGKCTKKDEARKLSPYICPWDRLAMGTRKYDLIPVLMMSQEP